LWSRIRDDEGVTILVTPLTISIAINKEKAFRLVEDVIE
jgi:hypothetical protein